MPGQAHPAQEMARSQGRDVESKNELTIFIIIKINIEALTIVKSEVPRFKVFPSEYVFLTARDKHFSVTYVIFFLAASPTYYLNRMLCMVTEGMAPLVLRNTSQ